MNQNEHIVEFCKDYVTDNDDADYAILLKGSWGCGKTYIWENRIKKELLNEKLNEDEIWYISLFGLQTVNDLKDKFFEAAHPLISSKNGKKLTSLSYNVLKSTIKYKLNLDVNQLGDSLLNIFKDNNISCRLIVLDDIERSELSPTQLLGFMYGFILTEKIKVIFIGEEEKYIRKFSNEKQKYEEIREKAIGATLEIVPENKIAIHQFVDCFDINKIKVPNIEEKILNIMEKLKITNLRIIKQTLRGLMKFYEKISPKYMENQEYNEKIVSFYMVFMINHLEGYFFNDDEQRYDENKITDSWMAFIRYNQNLKEFEKNLNSLEEKEKEKFEQNLRWDRVYHPIYIPDIWYRLIVNCDYNKDMINERIKKDYESRFNIKTQTSLERLKFGYMNMDSNEFEIVFKSLISDFENGKYLNYFDICAIIGLIENFENQGLLPNTKKELTEKINKFIRDFSGKLEPRKGGFNIDDLKQGHNEVELKCDEFKIVRTNLQKSCNYSYKKTISDKFKDSFNNENDCDYLFDVFHGDGMNIEYEIPIMSLIDIKQLYVWLKGQSNQMHDRIYYFLETRYGKRFSNGTLNKKYFVDYHNVNMLYKIYKKECNNQKKLYNPKLVYLKRIVKEYKGLLSYMRKHIIKYIIDNNKNYMKKNNINFSEKCSFNS